MDGKTKPRVHLNTEQQLERAVMIAHHIYHQLTHATPPTMSDVCAVMGVERATVHKAIALYVDVFGSEAPVVCAAVTNWLKSLRNNKARQQEIAQLTRELLDTPATWRVTSMEDIANTLGLPIELVQRYYGRYRDRGWPPMPKITRGWISQEAARAVASGNVELLERLQADEDQLHQMRQDIVDQRVGELA